MQLYKNTSGESGVLAYANGPDYIIIQFKEGRETFYKYTHQSAGAAAIEHMKRLAEYGMGLNSYVASKETRPSYATKAHSYEAIQAF